MDTNTLQLTPLLPGEMYEIPRFVSMKQKKWSVKLEKNRTVRKQK